METLDPQFLRTGTDYAPTPPVSLRAGPLTALFQPDDLFLRYIRIGDHEVVRGIYPAVRDSNWDTAPIHIVRLDIACQDASFQIRFEAECRLGDIDFGWRGRIAGEADGRVVYDVEGEPRRAFRQNRIGLCVLHPIEECAGKPCRVEHGDGSVSDTVFPKLIAPNQPILDIRALTYEPAPGARVEVRCEGEAFEMEDHRNWTDASYKTYAPPLQSPWPAWKEPGQIIRQTVTVSFPTPPRRILPILLGRGAQLSITTTPVFAKPALGVCQSAAGNRLTPRQLERIARLDLSHIRADVRFDKATWPDRLSAAAADAGALGAGLHLALHLTDKPEADLEALRSVLTTRPAEIRLLLIFRSGAETTPADLLALARSRLAGSSVNRLFAAGTDAYFAEINRDRPGADCSALPCFSINPQIHAFDNLSLIETLAAQPMALESLRSFAPRAAVISPITLRPRFNPNATATSVDPTQHPADPRQGSLFGAGWTLGSLSRLTATDHLHSLTYYETIGAGGLMSSELRHGEVERVYPVYHVLADLAGYDRIYPTVSSHPLQLEGMTIINANGQRRVLLANLLSETQEIRIKSGSCRARVRYLDETNALHAMTDPERYREETGQEIEATGGKLVLQLLPYALARVDIA